MVTYHLCFSVCSVWLCLGYSRLRWTWLAVALGHGSSSQNLQCRHRGLQKPSHNPKQAKKMKKQTNKKQVYWDEWPPIKKKIEIDRAQNTQAAEQNLVSVSESGVVFRDHQAASEVAWSREQGRHRWLWRQSKTGHTGGVHAAKQRHDVG